MAVKQDISHMRSILIVGGYHGWCNSLIIGNLHVALAVKKEQPYGVWVLSPVSGLISIVILYFPRAIN